MTLPKFANRPAAVDLVTRLGEDFAVVQNPSYVYPPYELYPLPPKRTMLSDGIIGAVMDMDGTTTTTEPLCIHSLETMVRRITGREDDAAWTGLNAERDYPNIIGNSTTKHVEYLIRAYAKESVDEAFRFFFIYAAIWTLGRAVDEGRRKEVRNNAVALGIGGIVNDPRFQELMNVASLDAREARQGVQALVRDYGPKLDLASFSNKVRAAVDIYYQRYHFILGRIEAGEGDAVAREVFGAADKRLICPMKGIGLFLAMVKGWLGNDVAFCFDDFVAHLVDVGAGTRQELEPARGGLTALGSFFERNPIRVAIVTSSISYEANIVLTEVFRVLAREIEGWGIPGERKSFLLDRFAAYRDYYDGFVTASDSSEIRLKPHRDLYSIALHQMGIPPDAFHKVIGFEDSESGVVAIRAAGIPCCCALPFPETKGHSFDAACTVAYGGIPEVILRHNLFLPVSLLHAH